MISSARRKLLVLSRYPVIDLSSQWPRNKLNPIGKLYLKLCVCRLTREANENTTLISERTLASGNMRW